MNSKLDKQSLQYLGIVLAAAILVCVVVFYYVSQVLEIEIKPTAEKGPETLTPEKIKKILSQPAESLPEQPLTEEEISEALNKK